MSREKKVFSFYGVELRLYWPEDLSKQWFLEYYQEGRRRKKYGCINQFDTEQGRLRAAEEEARQLAPSLINQRSIDVVKLEQYLERRRGEWRHSTYQNVKSIITAFADFLGNRQLSREVVEEFFQELRSKRHTTTYNNYVQWMDRIFRDLRRYDLMVNVDQVKTIKTPARYFQPHQVRRLRQVIAERNPELWLYVQFVFYCFLRPGRELPHLTAGDILMEEKKIYVPGQISKNKKSQYVAIPDPLYRQLEFVYDMGPGEYLFPSRVDQSKPLGRNYMALRHREILKELNFGRGFSLYSWKHTGAVMAAKAGISLKALQLQLRHHSLDETDKYLRQLNVMDLGALATLFPDINH